MSFYECAGNLYSVDSDGDARPMSVTAKDKVKEVRQIESITTEVGEDTVDLPKDARPISMGEVVAKFNLNESNPITFDKDVHEAQLAEGEEEPVEPTTPPVTEPTTPQQPDEGSNQQTPPQEPVVGEAIVSDEVTEPTDTTAVGFETIGTVDGEIENVGADDDSLFAGV